MNPWEKYQQNATPDANASAADGPWSKYQQGDGTQSPSMPGKIDMRADTSNVNNPIEAGKEFMNVIGNPVGSISKAITGKTLAENIGGPDQDTSKMSVPEMLGYNARKALGDATEGTANMALGGGAINKGKETVEAFNALKNNISRMALNPEFRSTSSTLKYDQDAKRVMQNMPDIVGDDVHSTLQAVNNKTKEVGQAIGDTIDNHPNANVKLDASHSILKPFSDKIAELNKIDPKANAHLIKRLKDAQQSMIKITDENGKEIGTTDLQNMTPRKLFDFRQQKIDPRTRYTGNPSDDKDLNEVFQQVKSNVRDLQNKNMPELKPLNQDYGDLHAAGDAMQKLVNKVDNEGLPNINWKDVTTLGIHKWLANPVNRINMSRWLYTAPKAQIQQVAQSVPNFYNGVRQSYGGFKNATLVTKPKGIGGPPTKAPLNAPSVRPILSSPRDVPYSPASHTDLTPSGIKMPNTSSGTSIEVPPLARRDRAVYMRPQGTVVPFNKFGSLAERARANLAKKYGFVMNPQGKYVHASQLRPTSP